MKSKTAVVGTEGKLIKDEKVENEREMDEWEGMGWGGVSRRGRRGGGEGGVEVVGRMPGLGLRGWGVSIANDRHAFRPMSLLGAHLSGKGCGRGRRWRVAELSRTM